MAEAACHAAPHAGRGRGPGPVYRAERVWLEGSLRKVTLKVGSEAELLAVYDKALKAGVLVQLITDRGLTEFGGTPTRTCLAVGPDYDDRIDPVTGDLELY